MNYLITATRSTYAEVPIQGQKLIMTKLVQCVVVLSYHSTWENWLLSIITTIAAILPNQSLPILQILSIIITEINRLPFTSSKRSVINPNF